MLGSRIGSIAAVALLASQFGACGEAPEAGAVRHTDSKSTQGAQARTTKPGAPVDLKFELRGRPEAGRPLPIDIVVLPRAETESLRVSFIATAGLAVRPAPLPTQYDKVRAASEYRHTLNVVPLQDGVHYLHAIVVMDSPNGPQARAFSIPVVVGSGRAMTSSKAPPVDWTGQSIESLPAEQN